MPSAPLHPCVPGCPALLPRGVARCPTHARTKEHQRPNYDTRRWYRQARWFTLRARVLSTNPLCVDCQAQGRVTRATEVHHKVKPGDSASLFYNQDNLDGLCSTCHGIRTAHGE